MQFDSIDPAAMAIAIIAIIVTAESQSDWIDSHTDLFFASKFQAACKSFAIGSMQVKEGMYCISCDKVLENKDYRKAAAIAGKALARQGSWLTGIRIYGSEYNELNYEHYSNQMLLFSYWTDIPMVTIKLLVVPLLLIGMAVLALTAKGFNNLEAWFSESEWWPQNRARRARNYITDSIILSSLSYTVDRIGLDHLYDEASSLLIGLAACSGGRGLTGQITKVAVAARVLPSLGDLISDGLCSDIQQDENEFRFGDFTLSKTGDRGIPELILSFKNRTISGSGTPGTLYHQAWICKTSEIAGYTHPGTETYLCTLPAKKLLSQLLIKFALCYGTLHDVERAILFNVSCGCTETEFLVQALLIIGSRSTRYTIMDFLESFPEGLPETRQLKEKWPFRDVAERVWCRCRNICHCRFLPFILMPMEGVELYKKETAYCDIWIVVVCVNEDLTRDRLGVQYPVLSIGSLHGEIDRLSGKKEKILIAGMGGRLSYKKYMQQMVYSNSEIST